MEARAANFAKERVMLKRILRQHRIQFDKADDTETLRHKVEDNLLKERSKDAT